MSKYELVIDLRVAKALGLKVPQELIAACRHHLDKVMHNSGV
jgi:hypothetical protein